MYGSNEQLIESLEEWGDLAGVTTTDAMGLAATFGNLAQAQGISQQASSDLALEVADLAGDMASFNDADPSKVFQDLNKALLTTEREGMKSYGIAISEAEVKTRAAAIAAADGRDEVTKADRAYASYAIAVEQAGQAVGDLERTSDSAANRQRQLQASLKEMQEEIGRELLPVFHDLLEVAHEMTPAFKGAARSIGYLVQPLRDVMRAAEDLDTVPGRVESAWSVAGEALETIFGGIPLQLYRIVRSSEDAETAFKEFADTSRIIEDAVAAQRSLALEAAEATRELTEAQNDYRAAVEASYKPTKDYDAQLRLIISKYRIMKGLQPGWGDFGPIANPNRGDYGGTGGNPSDPITRYNSINGIE